MHYLGGVFHACTGDRSAAVAKTTVERTEPEQVIITLRAKNSPLQTVELTKEANRLKVPRAA